MCTFPDAKLDAYKSEVDEDAAKLEVFRDCFEQMAVKYCEYVAIVKPNMAGIGLLCNRNLNCHLAARATITNLIIIRRSSGRPMRSAEAVGEIAP